jgi:hypothetical protein
VNWGWHKARQSGGCPNVDWARIAWHQPDHNLGTMNDAPIIELGVPEDQIDRSTEMHKNLVGSQTSV